MRESGPPGAQFGWLAPTVSMALLLWIKQWCSVLSPRSSSITTRSAPISPTTTGQSITRASNRSTVRLAYKSSFGRPHRRCSPFRLFVSVLYTSAQRTEHFTCCSVSPLYCFDSTRPIFIFNRLFNFQTVYCAYTALCFSPLFTLEARFNSIPFNRDKCFTLSNLLTIHFNSNNF